MAELYDWAAAPFRASLTHMRAFIAVTVLGLCAIAPADADPEEPYLSAAFVEGRYDDAARTAAATPTADTHAFAARALLAKAMCGDGQPPADLLSKARAHAEASLSLDPHHIEGRLQLAIARSLIARPLGTRASLDAGHGGAIRDLTRSVLADDPGNAYAHGMMAVWHIEVIRRGGRIGAAIMGADIDTARNHYREAVAAKPDDASIHWQYARALAALNPKRFKADITTALDAARDTTHETALEATMAKRAETLARLMAAGDDRVTKAAAADDML